MTIYLTVAQALAEFGSGTLPATIGIVDTTRNVADNIDALQAIVGHLGAGIGFTNGGRSVLAITSTQLANDAAVLALIVPPRPICWNSASPPAKLVRRPLQRAFIILPWSTRPLGALRTYRLLRHCGKPVRSAPSA